MILTDEQQDFLNYVVEKTEFTGIITLNAPAGSGKTECIKELNKLIDDLIIMAPTNKAVSVLVTSMEKDDSYKDNCTTVHRFLRAKEEYDNNGNLKFKFNYETIMGKIIIIDESSMINSEIFEEFKKISETNLIIFSGDKSQIPPVNEVISKVFELPTDFTFTKNMRTNNSLHYLQAFREKTNRKYDFSQVKINKEDKIDRSSICQSEYLNSDTIILAWTNKRVDQWNRLIRKVLFQDTVLEDYYIGEKLIISGHYKFNSTTYYSNDIIEIIKVEKEEIDISYPYCICDKDFDIFDFYKKCDICNVSRRKIKTKKLKFYKLTDSNNCVWFKCLDDKEELKSILSKHKESTFSKTKNHKNNNLWSDYYELIKKYDPDIKYCYSLTIHKAQGSQYDNVLIDINDICKNNNLTERNKLLYTAVSRYINNLKFFV